MNTEEGSHRFAIVSAVIILIAACASIKRIEGIIGALFIAAIGYAFVYFGSIWVLKGFTKEQKSKQKKSE